MFHFFDRIEPRLLASVLQGYDRADAYIAFLSAAFELALAGMAILWAAQHFVHKPRVGRIVLWLLLVPGVLLLLATGQILLSHHYAPFQEHERVTRWLLKKYPDIIVAAFAAFGMLAAYKLYLPEHEGFRRTLRPDQHERGEAIRHGFMTGLGGVALAFYVFFNFNYTPDPFVKEFNALFNYYIPEIRQVIHLTVLIKAVVLEEITYRLFTQGLIVFLLVKHARWTPREAAWPAILFSALLWTWAHEGSFEFSWAKYLQIFPFGVALGILMERRGLWACLAAHFVYNSFILAYATIFRYLPPVDFFFEPVRGALVI